MCVLCVKEPIRKESGNLSYAPRISEKRIVFFNLFHQPGSKRYCMEWKHIGKENFLGVLVRKEGYADTVLGNDLIPDY